MRTLGSVVDTFRLDQYLGEGGMAEVYRAFDLQHQRPVAIKFPLSTDPTLERFFKREVLLSARIQHPHVLRTYTSSDNPPYLVMELAKSTLQDRLAPDGLRYSLASGWAIEFADGLTALHTNELVHRDLKPSNIFISDDDHIRVADFGLSKIAGSPTDQNASTDPQLTPHGRVVGTPAYMAPEAHRGQYGFQADQYAFGVIVHEMLSGHRPNGAEPGDHFGPAVYALLKRCLADDPAARYRCTDDLLLAARAAFGAPGPNARYRAPIEEKKGVTLALEYIRNSPDISSVRLWGYSFGWAREILKELRKRRYAATTVKVLHPSHSALSLFKEDPLARTQNASRWATARLQLEEVETAEIMECDTIPDLLGVLVDQKRGALDDAVEEGPTFLLLGRYGIVERDGGIVLDRESREERTALVYAKGTAEAELIIECFDYWFRCRAHEARATTALET